MAYLPAPSVLPTRVTRRNFVRTAPLAAGVLLPLSGLEQTIAQASGKGNFQLFSKEVVDAIVAGQKTVPGNKDLVPMAAGLGFSMTITTEEKKAPADFEWHEHRDHVFQILEGVTIYEVGGTPKNARMTKPGEWLAAECEGATRLTLKQGDFLTLPRMTPHKRITEGKVTLLLISPAS